MRSIRELYTAAADRSNEGLSHAECAFKSRPGVLVRNIASKRARALLTATTLLVLALFGCQRMSAHLGAAWWIDPNLAIGHDLEKELTIAESNDFSTQITDDDVHWSRFAYAQYVTGGLYLCNSVMFFERLARFKSRADRVLMYPSFMLEDVNAEESEMNDARLLIKARDEYGVKLVPITVQRRPSGDGKLVHLCFPLFSYPLPPYLILANPVAVTWQDSFTKLLVFNQTEYDRVLILDSDSTLLQHMDELFLVQPFNSIAMPRAYWLGDGLTLSSQLMLIRPSEAEFARVQARIAEATTSEYDMEIVNALYAEEALVLPHRPYNLLSAEFRRGSGPGGSHAPYLGSSGERWNPVAAYNEAKYVHFSDWPLPKPWKIVDEETMAEHQPTCVSVNGDAVTTRDCTARDLWRDLYRDFRERRKVSASFYLYSSAFPLRNSRPSKVD